MSRSFVQALVRMLRISIHDRARRATLLAVFGHLQPIVMMSENG